MGNNWLESMEILKKLGESAKQLAEIEEMMNKIPEIKEMMGKNSENNDMKAECEKQISDKLKAFKDAADKKEKKKEKEKESDSIKQLEDFLNSFGFNIQFKKVDPEDLEFDYEDDEDEYEDEEDEEEYDCDDCEVCIEVDRIWHEFDKKTGHVTTTVKWIDGTKTTVDNKYANDGNDWFGFCSALAKKVYGSTSAAIAQKEYGEGRGMKKPPVQKKNK